MSDLNKLKELANRTHGEEWEYKVINGDKRVIVKGSLERGQGYFSCRSVVDEIDSTPNAKFIAAANPATVIGLIDRLEAAEAELARRDAAAGEPVAAYRYRFIKPAVTDRDGNPWVSNWKYCNAEDSQCVNRSAGYEVQELFTAAQPSALPPEITWVDLCEKNPEMFMGDAIIRAASYNQAIADAKALGCKGFVVKRPNLPDDCDRTEAHYKYREAIKAAGGTVSDD